MIVFIVWKCLEVRIFDGVSIVVMGILSVWLVVINFFMVFLVYNFVINMLICGYVVKCVLIMLYLGF